MHPLSALIYSFLFGLLHGILPDEHTWPITFSYAIGGASGKEGMKAGFFFSLAFTVQRAIIAELAYLALAPFLLTSSVNGVVYIVVGLVMIVAGRLVLGRRLYPHFHLLGHHHDDSQRMAAGRQIFARRHREPHQDASLSPPPVRWTLVHGFIAGFGFGGFALFVNTIAVPAMPNAWIGFLPGLLFGAGTMLMLLVVGWVFGASLRWFKGLEESQIKRIGAETGGRTLFFGGLLFALWGVATELDLIGRLPVDAGYILVGVFMAGVVVPAFVYSLRQVRSAGRDKKGPAGIETRPAQDSSPHEQSRRQPKSF